MRAGLTELVIILDRSGSMHVSREEAEKGLTHLVKLQKSYSRRRDAGELRLTLVQFDNIIETVYEDEPIENVSEMALKIEPRNMTALLDAVGDTIVRTGQRYMQTPDKDRPGLVLVAIVTDGMENCSRSYTRDRVREMIEHQTEVYKWQFTYIGANQDAFAEAGSMGISRDAVANYTQGFDDDAYGALGAKFARMREEFASGRVVSNAFSQQERDQIK